MPENPQISIVVPVYNTQKWLDRCVQSLLEQTVQDFEIILVNDGSTDNSGEKCQSWAQRDSRIQVISQRNRGLSAARNKGLDESLGEFVCFIDSDDFIEPQFIETALQGFKLGGETVDVSCMGIIDQYGDRQRISTTKIHGIVGYSDFFRLVLLGHAPGSICNRVFRKTALHGVRFRVGRHYEDMFFNGDCIGHLRDVWIELAPLYIYDHRPESITTTAFNPRVIDCIRSAESCVEIADDLGEEVRQAARFRATWSRFHVLDRMLSSRAGREYEYGEFKTRLVRDLRGRTREVISSPHFSRGRKLASLVLLISQKAYQVLVSVKGYA